MPAGVPKLPSFAMRLWLAQRLGWKNKAGRSSVAPSHPAVRPMSIESIEHIVRNRARMFLRHTWLVTIVGSIVIGGVLWAAFYFLTAPTVMRIAVGPSGGIDDKVVQVLMQKITGNKDKIQLVLVVTAGPNESADALKSGTADLAILPSTVGTSPDWPVVAILRQNVMALVVPASPTSAGAKKEAAAPEKKETSAAEKKEPEAKEKAAKSGKAAKGAAAKAAKNDKATKEAKVDKEEAKATKSEDTGDDAEAADPNKLDKVAKLAGHRVGIVAGSVATPKLLNVVLDHYGVARDSVQVSQIEPQNLADAVKSNQIDAIFVAGSATGKSIGDAVAAASQNGQAPSFIAIDQADGIAKRNPAFDSVEIDAGTFGGHPPSPDDKLTSLSFPEYLVARKAFNHEAVATLAKLIYTSRLALAVAMPGEIKIEAPSTDKDASVAVHVGALAYLNDDQKSFFDKYGDDIFYGLLIFPIFGSAIAGVATYFRNSHRTRRLRLLQKLLDLVRKAHVAPSLEALDQLQIDLDHLVVTIIHQSEHDEYDQTVQTSFSLALDQARFAIGARRAVLLEGGADSKVGGKFAAA
jgi:TRAP-type uncharacterized transport system substrate-binding protein